MKKVPFLAFLLTCFCAVSMAQGPYQHSKPSADDKGKLVKLEKAYKAAKALLAKSPKSAKAKADFTTIGAAYGHESMMSTVLDRKIKYRQALRIYREVLKVDPNQAIAKQESEMIISIYKQMNRPIPKD